VVQFFHKVGKMGFLRLLAGALFAGALWAGCFFESTLPTTITPVGQSDADLTLLDEVPVTGPTDSSVQLYLPGLDPTMAAASENKKAYAKVKVRDHLSGKVVEYGLTTQRFKKWSAEQEFQWNFFRLQTSFFFPKEMPDTAGIGFDTRELYARIGSVDRFSRYVDSTGAAEERRRLLTTRTAALGLRLDLVASGDSIVVKQAVENAPAWRKGIRTGMRIVAVGDSSVVGDSALTRFSVLTRGDSGAVIRLTVVGASGSFSAEVIKEPVDFPSILLDSVGGIPVIGLFVFADSTLRGQNTVTEFREALRATQNAPVFVLDLRQDPGGSLNQALLVADELLGGDVTIIRQEQRYFDDGFLAPLFAAKELKATKAGLGHNRKVVLLADSGSASASEILIAALRDGLSAPLVGTKTYGKGIGQIVLTTPGGGLALITHLHFVAPKGEKYHKVGLKPDHAVDGTSAQALEKAVAVALEMSGTPLAKQAGSSLRAKAWAQDVQRFEANRQERLYLKGGALELSE
jgi:carboxyl-terminal processing protease